MKKSLKLLPLLLVALALNPEGNSAEAKKLPSGKKVQTGQTSASIPETMKELYTIREISFIGLESVNEQELIGSLPLKSMSRIAIPGLELTNALQYLWQLQLFSDIKVEKTDLGQKSIALKFIVTELPVLDEVTFKGNRKFKNDELKRIAALVTGKKVVEQELLTAANKIEKHYATKGYLTAGAEFQLKELGRNHVSVAFTITEGTKVAIEKINFHGNTAFKPGKLRGVLKETHQNSWWRKIFGAPKLDKDKFEEDKNNIVEYYRNNGYRDAKVLRDELNFTRDRKGLILDIYLEEGTKYHIGNITWSGNTKDFATTAILGKTFRIKKGDLYNAKLIQDRLNYSQDNTDVSSLYLDRGYLSFKTSIDEVVSAPGTVDLAVSIREGEPYEINKVSITGNTKTKDHVVRRELYSIPGDTFSRKNVVRSIREISMLNYFDPSKIEPDIEPNPENNTVNVIYNVAEKQSDTFNASVGYSSNGFTGALGVTFNNFSLEDIFNRSAYKPLPHGDGQKLGFQWQFGSNSYRTLSLSFTEPWAFGSPTTLGFSAFKTHMAYDYTDDTLDNPTDIDQYGATLSVGRRLTWPDNYFTIGWKLKYLHTKGGFLTFIEELPDAPEEADEVSISQTIRRNSIDNPIFPRRGSNNWITAQLAGGPLPGSVDFYKFTAGSTWYFPITRKLVLNLSTQHGYLSTFNENDYIPYTEYFYMGGSGMSSLPTVPLRGYDDRSLGVKLDPDNEDSTLYAGKVYSKFTSELRYPLTMSQSVSIYGLVFAEAGGLWENAESVNFGELKKSAGVGLRLYLPIIGQIGFDYGYGFDAVPRYPDEKGGWKFLFTFGTQE
ncbi:MAG: outer membrane protein assembly factor BamA [Chlorobiaceae bacterium]|nr:outer membrane protein assembly factor BamA [Chlorobiaceae bacterium]NTV61235.1 outer membrane protein assembly factor BamA [Chlorobiaceae bacterium]